MSTAFYLNPKNKDPERAQALQRYLVLHSQQESLRRRRSSSRSSSGSPSRAPSASSSRRNSPPLLSPRPYPQPSGVLWPSTSQLPPPIVEEDEFSEEDEKLYDINLQIKSVLMTLMNCETVQHDLSFRAWVSNKLMDAEHDMSQQRRRQGAPEQDVVAKVSQRLR